LELILESKRREEANNIYAPNIKEGGGRYRVEAERRV
jgi:hypothetical protein